MRPCVSTSSACTRWMTHKINDNMTAPAPQDSAAAPGASDDVQAMALALQQARRAAAQEEVPVGAVVMHKGQVIGTGHNATIAGHDPSAHAEILALRAAAQHLGNYRLTGCTLYVTLEPCVMCAGAILNARVDRVVFGAYDARAGAAGSVIDLFSNNRLNHQTQVEGGVCAEQSRALLQAFFQARRAAQPWPLRDDALRNPDTAFAPLPEYPWSPHYTNTGAALDGLRLHYLDEGPQSATTAWLCLHPPPLWSYVYRHLIAALLACGQRVLAPDWPGFGKSDKPKKARAHSTAWQAQVLLDWLDAVAPPPLVIVSYGLANAAVAALLTARPQQVRAVLLVNGRPDVAPAECPRSAAQWLRRNAENLSTAERNAYAAPFPNAGFEAALRAFADQAAPQSLPNDLIASWQEQQAGQTQLLQVISKGSTKGDAADTIALHIDGPQAISATPNPDNDMTCIPPCLRTPQAAAQLASGVLAALNPAHPS